MDLRREIRKLRWQTGRRTLPPAKVVSEEHLLQAQDLHRKGYYEEALDRLHAIPRRDADPRCVRLMGLCRLGLREFDESVALFTRAREMNTEACDWPEVASDEANLTAAFLATHRNAEALETAHRAVKIDPDWVGTHINLIAALNRVQDSDKLDEVLLDIATNRPGILVDEEFRERICNDSDFLGIGERISRIAVNVEGESHK
jgi:tetratricopeptide (TPR) repeat protein